MACWAARDCDRAANLQQLDQVEFQRMECPLVELKARVTFPRSQAVLCAQLMDALNDMVLPSGTKVSVDAWWMDTYSYLALVKLEASKMQAVPAWTRP